MVRQIPLPRATVEPTEPPMEEHQPQEPIDRDDINGTPNQQNWWDDTDVSRLIDLEAFCHFLYSSDQLLENSDPDGDDDEGIPHALGTNNKLTPEKQPKLGWSPSMNE